MGLFGGSSQSTSSSSNILDFAPVFNIGEDITSSTDKTLEQTSSVAPKLDDSIGVSASVGVAGGSGGTATLQRSQNEDAQPTVVKSANSSDNKMSELLPFLLIGGAVVVVVGLMNKKAK